MTGHAIVFNLKGNFIIAEFNFKNVVRIATFSKDGKLFAIAQDHGFSVYECPPLYRTFEPFVLIKKYKNRHSSDICSMNFSPDSRFIVTAGLDNIIYLNNLFPIPDYVALSFEVHRFKIIGVHFSHDMKYLFSVDSGSNIFVWKWVTDHITDAYKNLQASKKRKISNKKGVSVQNTEEDNSNDK